MCDAMDADWRPYRIGGAGPGGIPIRRHSGIYLSFLLLFCHRDVFVTSIFAMLACLRLLVFHFIFLALVRVDDCRYPFDGKSIGRTIQFSESGKQGTNNPSLGYLARRSSSRVKPLEAPYLAWLDRKKY